MRMTTDAALRPSARNRVCILVAWFLQIQQEHDDHEGQKRQELDEG